VAAVLAASVVLIEEPLDKIPFLVQ